jgi:alpha-D-ribose 1-methylphosphonate 5-triphosphate diphosphatase PhnM
MIKLNLQTYREGKVMNESDTHLVMAALSTVHQAEFLGFTEEEKARMGELIDIVEGMYEEEDSDELSFDK